VIWREVPSVGSRCAVSPRALACGGADAVSNMQWQTTRAARAKDKWEMKGCARYVMSL